MLFGAVVPLSGLLWVVPLFGRMMWTSDLNAYDLGWIVGTIAARVHCQTRDAPDHIDVLALAEGETLRSPE
jgi:hypothetical protein